MVMEVVFEDMGEGSMHCANHRYKNGTPGGICAYCLQEKLGKLVSSSFAATVFQSSQSSSTPSRSDFDGGTTSTGSRTAAAAATSLHNRYFPSSSSNSQNPTRGNDGSNQGYDARRSRLAFNLARERQRTADGVTPTPNSSSIALKRSKSTTTPRRGLQISDENYSEDLSPYRRGFWTFLHSSKHSTVKTSSQQNTDLNFSSATPSSNGGVYRSEDKKKDEFLVVDENSSPDEGSFDRRVSRSRSVGCGSRSFSGDFFERISTGFGDCTLRRVESQREGKPKTPSVDASNGGKHYMRERMKCGGIFSGFVIPSSASSSSTEENMSRKSFRAPHTPTGYLSHGRIKSWGWALTSPMRAFVKPSIGKRLTSSNKNATPNLDAIPSLLAVSS